MNRFSLVFFLVFLSVAHARLGETEKQLTERFGQPASRSQHSILAQGKMWPLGPTLNFRQDDWQISCDLVDARVVRIEYVKRGDWTEEQIRTTLNANAQGLTWTDTTKGSPQHRRTWTRGDGATARWGTTFGMHMTVPAYERAKAVAEAKAKAETRKPAKI